MSLYPNWLIIEGRRYKPETELPPLFWIPHDRFRFDYDNRAGGGWKYNPAGTGQARLTARVNGSMPEVYRLEPQHPTKLDSGWQNLLCEINPHLSRDKALSLLGTGLAWCNGQDNVFDQPRLCGGAVVTGRIDGGKLWVKTMLTSQPVPPAAQVLADRTLWYWATGVQPDGDVNLFQRRGLDGQMHPVRMFIVTAQPVWVPLDELLRVDRFVEPQWTP